MSTALETRVAQGFQATAVEEVKTEHKQYFDAINKHPRLLVGTEVPAIGKEGTEVIRDSEDAKEWQEAVKTLLVEEINARVSKSMEDTSGYLDTVHQSIELFQNNADLIPGTKEFDVELANRFAVFSKPYEVRDDDKKLHGFSVPVQPIIDQLRAILVEERKKAPAAPSPAAGGAPAAGAPAATAQGDKPQGGIQSKAGASSDDEGMATFWGTLGLPDLRL